MTELRPARPEDLPQVRALVDAAYGVYLPRIGQRPGPMDDDYAARQAAGELQVLADGDTVCGLLVLLETADGPLLDNVAVAPAAQGRGLGRQLIAAAEAQARARGHTRLRLYTHARMTENQTLYRRLGWRAIGRVTECGFDRVYFEKRLIDPGDTMSAQDRRPAAESTVKLENERVRVTEWRFAPGAATGWHRHAYDYVVVPLSDGALTLVGADGEETRAQLSHGAPALGGEAGNRSSGSGRV